MKTPSPLPVLPFLPSVFLHAHHSHQFVLFSANRILLQEVIIPLRSYQLRSLILMSDFLSFLEPPGIAGLFHTRVGFLIERTGRK